SDEVFQHAECWLSNCISDHKPCTTAPVALLPTRIIDVSHPSNPLLYVSSYEVKGQYFALSYCRCHSTKDHVLITSTLADMQKSITLQSLLKTIPDAITITHRFGYRFIWIDALCILQDSLDDWECKASEMCSIYSRATMTIAPASANQASEGTIVYLRYRTPAFYDRLQPLHARAWTLQERKLSPCTLLYNSHYMTWECVTHTIHEGEGSGRHKKKLLNLPNDSGTDNGIEFYYFDWTDIVSDYSKRQVTVPTDKLPAIPGIAALFGSTMENTAYFAGLWRSNFPAALIWHVMGQTKAVRCKHCRAPSWSWACLDTPVVFSIVLQHEIKVEILSIETHPSTLNRFGAVKSGQMHLR
ncbi:HET-domain-containing protein, partial [Lentithecium fluviatile CBS 122367]